MVSLHARVREYVFVTPVRSVLFSILTTLLFGMTGVFAENIDPSWPQFHGPDRDNISRETGLLKTWPNEGPSLVWTANGLGHGFSSISIADGIICTAGNIEKDTVITALNMKGKVLWRSKNGKAWTRDHPGTRSTPTIDGTRIYHQSPLGNIACLRAETGEVVWSVDILKKVRSKSSTWALAESLLIDGDHLISCPGGPETCMVALDKNTGSIIWKAPSTGELAGYSARRASLWNEHTPKQHAMGLSGLADWPQEVHGQRSRQRVTYIR